MASSGELKVCSMNCRGLGEYKKRRDVFNFLKGMDCNLFLLQDIHCAKERVNSFRNLWGTDILLAPYKNNARGVGIFTKNIDISFADSKIDDNGNYIVVKATINQEFDIIIANVYGPNSDNPTFFDSLKNVCLDMTEKETIPVLIAGDLNMALDVELDTFNYIRENNVNAKNLFLNIMHENNWFDVFRNLNGDLRRYTWRVRRPAIKQARLDYFIASDSLLPFIVTASIEPGYRTDHSMVLLSINLNNGKRGKGFFKFNCALLEDMVYTEKVRNIIRETIGRYALPIYSHEFMLEYPGNLQYIISDSLLWETILLNIRTETVSYGIHKKRSLMRMETKLIKDIAEAELAVQTHCTDEAMNLLEMQKSELEEIRKVKMEGIITRSRAKWHESGEKSTSYFLSLEKT